MNEPAEKYRLLTSEHDYRTAIDTVLDQAKESIDIFDRDLARLRPEEPQRLAELNAFLNAGRANRLRIVLHDPRLLHTRLPRLSTLLIRYAHAVSIRQSPEDLRQLADTHLLADARHGVCRFHIDHARCALILDDPAAIRPKQSRFENLWELSTPCPNPIPASL